MRRRHRSLARPGSVVPRSTAASRAGTASSRGYGAVSGQRLVARPARQTQARASRARLTIECRKVALLGAAGGIGQPLAMLLKMNRQVTELALYDIANVVGVAADLSHCNTPVKVGAAPPASRCAAAAAHRELAQRARAQLLPRRRAGAAGSSGAPRRSGGSRAAA